MADSKSSGGASATQDRQDKTDAALKNERDSNGGDDRYGGSEPLPYPDHEPLDEVTYRDPRPHDWPVKADRSVFIGVVHKADPDPDADDPKGDYIYANQLDLDDEDEIKISGTKVEHAQVFAGSGQLRLVINGDMYDLGALGGGISADLQKALQLNANS